MKYLDKPVNMAFTQQASIASVKTAIWTCFARGVGAGVVRVVFTTPIFFQPQFFLPEIK